MANCPWPIDITSCCTDSGLNPEVPSDAAKIASVVEQVSAMMSRWSGFAFGGCATVRPLDPCGECRSGCCGSGDCIVLHNASSVTEVRIRGTVVPETDYFFDATRGTLCAAPGLTWPTRDPRYTSNGELEVDVMIGAEPDAWALAVASELACELLLACGGKKCRIPDRAVSVTSQGVTISLRQDDLTYALPSVLSWVNTVNPKRATAPARVFSPELRRANRGGRMPAPWRRR